MKGLKYEKQLDIQEHRDNRIQDRPFWDEPEPISHQEFPELLSYLFQKAQTERCVIILSPLKEKEIRIDYEIFKASWTTNKVDFF